MTVLVILLLVLRMIVDVPILKSLAVFVLVFGFLPAMCMGVLVPVVGKMLVLVGVRMFMLLAIVLVRVRVVGLMPMVILVTRSPPPAPAGAMTQAFK